MAKQLEIFRVIMLSVVDLGLKELLSHIPVVTTLFLIIFRKPILRFDPVPHICLPSVSPTTPYTPPIL